ncbi:hypothetical protein Taro_021594, partial [Colocasia esculenta]|nr:hypothetical protein [Colocasia esculenta]
LLTGEVHRGLITVQRETNGIPARRTRHCSFRCLAPHLSLFFFVGVVVVFFSSSSAASPPSIVWLADADPKVAAMANPRSGALLALLIVAAFLLVAPSAATSDSPFMVVHKKASLARLKSGAEQVSVSIDIYNQGSATAYDVSLNDDSWDKDIFDLVSGTTSKSWERLDAGSISSHLFVLESKLKGAFHGAPAVVKFRVPTKTALQEAYSTPILPLDILADKPPVKKFDWVKTPGKIWIAGFCGFTSCAVRLPGCKPFKIQCCKGKQEKAVNHLKT